MWLSTVAHVGQCYCLPFFVLFFSTCAVHKIKYKAIPALCHVCHSDVITFGNRWCRFETSEPDICIVVNVGLVVWGFCPRRCSKRLLCGFRFENSLPILPTGVKYKIDAGVLL